MMGVTSASAECDASRIFFGSQGPGLPRAERAKEPEGVETKHEEDDVVGRADAVGRCRVCAGEPARCELQRHRNLRSHGTWRRKCSTEDDRRAWLTAQLPVYADTEKRSRSELQLCAGLAEVCDEL